MVNKLQIKTTLKLIDSLLQAGILLDLRGKRNANDLTINKNFDFEDLMNRSFMDHVKTIEKSLGPFKTLIKNRKIKGKAKVSPKGDVSVILDI